MQSTSTSLTLSLGWNTLYAYICNSPSPCNEQTIGVYYMAGRAPIVSLAPHNADLVDYARCANACFAATYAQSTVPYFSLGAPRSVTLVYNGDRANPKPFLRVDVTHGGNSGDLPDYFYLRAKHGSSWITFVNGETSLHFAASAGAALRLAGQFSAAANNMDTTKVYPVTIVVGASYTAGVVEDTLSTRVIVVSEDNAPAVARGWTVGGVQRAYVQPSDSSLLVVEADGSATYFAKSGSSFTTPAGDFTHVSAAGSGSGRTYLRAYPDSTKITYNYQGLMLTAVDAWGNTDSVTYDGYNRVYRMVDPLGNYHQLAYNSYGLSSITALSRTTNVTVQSNGRLTAITDPDGVSTSLAYDDSLRLATVTDRRGVTVTEFRYHNASNRVDSVMGPSVTLYTGSSARPTAVFAAWQLMGVPYAATSSTPATPPRADTVGATVTDPGGHATRYTVNALGQPLAATGPLGNAVTIHYTAAFLPDSATPTWGARVGHHYDGSGLDTAVTVEGLRTHLMYRHGFAVADTVWGDATPTQRSIVGTHGGVTGVYVTNHPASGYTYDSRGRITGTADPEGHGRAFWFDTTTGNVARDSVAGGAVRVYGYDAFGRLTSDSLVGVARRTMVYDTLNRVVAVYDGVNASAAVRSYDALLLRATTDPAGNTDSVTYNDMGWPIRHRDAAGHTDTLGYDLDGLVWRSVNRRGQAITYTYDAGHRLRARSGTRIAADTVTFVADSVVRTANAAAAETQYVNRRGQADSVKTVLTIPGTGTQTYWQRFRYRTNGLLDSVWITGPSVNFLTRRYGYDSALAVDSIKLGSHSWTWMRLNNDGMPVATHLPGGDSIAQGWSPLNLPSDLTSSVLNDGYDYDSIGRLAVHRMADPYYQYSWKLTTVHGYDALSRLTGSSFYSYACSYGESTCNPGVYAPDSSHGAAYDAVGNRTDNSGSYGAGSRIQAWSSCSYTTDADGNVTQRSCPNQTVNFTWTADGHLDSMLVVGGPTLVFAYDPSGRLVRRDSVGSVAANFLWQGGNLLAELGPAGTTRLGEYSYYAGLDQLHAWRGVSAPYDTTVLYAHQDGRGNVRGLSWGWANSTERTYMYSEWGELNGGNGAATYDRARWKGALYMSPEADLYYMRARWYEPRTGRFLSEDPARSGTNPYVIAGANPVTGSDPTGKQCIRIRIPDRMPLIGGIGIELFCDGDDGDNPDPGASSFCNIIGWGRDCSAIDLPPQREPLVPPIDQRPIDQRRSCLAEGAVLAANLTIDFFAVAGGIPGGWLLARGALEAGAGGLLSSAARTVGAMGLETAGREGWLAATSELGMQSVRLGRNMAERGLAIAGREQVPRVLQAPFPQEFSWKDLIPGRGSWNALQALRACLSSR
jgi:RHS repeat-associated protein